MGSKGGEEIGKERSVGGHIVWLSSEPKQGERLPAKLSWRRRCLILGSATDLELGSTRFDRLAPSNAALAPLPQCSVCPPLHTFCLISESLGEDHALSFGS